ncbi:hypothetical protein PULV_a2324 [Pseudoalteromonas ulvae UL12]|nr:hypothetical protein [Pseudoalteromonas ulvae UL12]
MGIDKKRGDAAQISKLKITLVVLVKAIPHQGAIGGSST